MTKTMSKSGCFRVTAMLLGAFALVLSAQSGVANAKGRQSVGSLAIASEPTPDVFTENLIGYLEQGGFQVNEGKPMVYSPSPLETCQDYTYPALNSCLGSNPVAPYVIATVKSWPDEFVDPVTINAFGPVPEPGYSPTYRLDPREAIVIYGEMPPPGRYMGLQTWVWSQHGSWKTKDYEMWANTPNQPFPMSLMFSTMPPTDPESGRVFSFSALGDIINNVVMQGQLHELDEEDDNPFGKTLYFIITPSGSTDNAIRLALQAQGVPDGKIFTEQIPSRDNLGPIGPLGMGKNAIDFITWFRYAVPDNEKDAGDWRENLPLSVLRVRAPDSLGPVQRYGSLTFEQRTANSELDLESDLQDLVDAVCDSVISKTGLTTADCVQPPPESSFLVDPVREYGWTGPYCRKINMNCDGDQNDAAYFLSKLLPIDSGEVYIAIGTLATETGNATYVGLGVNDASTFFAPANVGDMTLKGSADVFAPPEAPPGIFDMFYVHFFTRDCTAVIDLLPPDRPQDCTEIDKEMVPPYGSTAPGDPALHGMVQIGLRDYIVPGTQRGPDSAKMLKPRVLTFTQP